MTIPSQTNSNKFLEHSATPREFAKEIPLSPNASLPQLSTLTPLTPRVEGGFFASVKIFFKQAFDCVCLPFRALFQAIYTWCYPSSKRFWLTSDYYPREFVQNFNIYLACTELLEAAKLGLRYDKNLETDQQFRLWVRNSSVKFPQAFQNLLNEHYLKITKMNPDSFEQVMIFFILRGFEDKSSLPTNIRGFFVETELGALLQIYVGKELVHVLEKMKQETLANRKISGELYSDVMRVGESIFYPINFYSKDFFEDSFVFNFEEKIKTVKSQIEESKKYLNSKISP